MPASFSGGCPRCWYCFIGGFFWLRSWLGSYLQSEAFRLWLGSMTSKQLDARCEYEPFHFSGLTVNADGFKAQGTQKAAFSTLELDKIRTVINLGGLWNKALEVDDVTVDHLQISLGHTGAPPVPESEIGVEPVQEKAPSSSAYTWLSPRLDLRKLVIKDTNVLWGENTPQAGSMTKTEVTAQPDGNAWNILLEGGTISQKGGPDLKLDHIKLQYQSPILDISEGLLQFPPGGDIGLTGQVNTTKNLEVHVKVNGIPLRPFLPPDVQSKLQGNVFADVKVSGTMPMEGAPEVSGVCHLENGYLTEIPILDFFAKLFHSPRFGKIALNTASANFAYAGEKVTVTNLVVESKGLMSVTGHFVINNSRIDGHFEVGIRHDFTRLPFRASMHR